MSLDKVALHGLSDIIDYLKSKGEEIEQNTTYLSKINHKNINSNTLIGRDKCNNTMSQGLDKSLFELLNKGLTMGFENTPENINRKGRPKKGTCLTDLMQKYLSKSIEVKGKGGQLKKVKYRDLFVQQVLKLATAGDTTCLKLIWNYIDGMPIQAIQHSGGIDHNPKRRNYTDEELNKIEEAQGIINETANLDSDNVDVA